MKYVPLGKGTGVRVSELVLGTAMFGTSWGYGAEASDAKAVLKAFLDAGGNFIDTAGSYQYGEAETIIGEAIAGIRDNLIIGTKYTESAEEAGNVSITGNSRKNMQRSLDASLKRLGTDRVDLYWVHLPDDVTGIEEIMRGFDDLARAGKILYCGLSNFPAWKVAQAATWASLQGTLPLAAIQIEYSLVERTADRELLPMAREFGLTPLAWSPLGGGVLTGKYREGKEGRRKSMGGALFKAEDSPQRKATLDVVTDIAISMDRRPEQIALAWLRSHGLLPIIGPRTPEQAVSNIASAEVSLSADDLVRLDGVSAVELGFPHDFLAPLEMKQRIAGGQYENLVAR